MKKMMMTLAAVLCCVMTTTVFTACGSDDDDKSDSKPAVDDSPVAVVMEYEVGTTQATLNIMDVVVEYYDADGKIQNEALTAESWKKTVQHKLPATVGLHMKAQLKPGFDPDSSEEVKISFERSFDGYTLFANGGKVPISYHDTKAFNVSTKSNKFSGWLTEESNNILPVLYIYDDKGQYSSGT
jgi:hypothetical protein